MRTPIILGTAMSKVIIYLLLLVIVIIVGINCKPEENIFPTIPKAKSDFIVKEFDNKVEQQFFNLGNNAKGQETNILSTRTSYFPEILIDVYNQIILDNEQDSFVYSVALRLGYPLWFESRMEDNNHDSLPEIIYIPFAFKNTTEISSYLIAYRNTKISETIKMEIRLRTEIDSIQYALKPYTSSTCHDVVRFVAFDSLLYQRPISTYDSLLKHACTATDDIFNSIGDQILPRTCDSEVVEICVWVDDDNPDTGTGVYMDWVYDDDGRPDQYVWPVASSPGEGYFWFFWQFIYKTDYVYFWNPRYFFHDPNEIKNRGFVLVCSDYLVIRCNNQGWWVTVAQIPCDGCDQLEEEEKAMEAYCRTAGSEFITKYGITDIQHRKKVMMASMSCCEDFNLPDECALQAYFDIVVKEAGLENDYLGLNDCERLWLFDNPTRAVPAIQSALAAYQAEKLHMNSTTHNRNGCGDAFRHAYWNALMTVAFSDNENKAKEFADAHECVVDPNRLNERVMDFYNNLIGREVGSMYNDNLIAHIPPAICSLLLNGHLRVLEVESNGLSDVISSDVNNCQCQ